MQLSLLALIPLATAFSLPWFDGQTLPSQPPFHWKHRTTPGSQLPDDRNGQTTAAESDDYRLSTPVSFLMSQFTDQAGQTTASSDQEDVTRVFLVQRYSNRPIPTLKHPTLPPHNVIRFSRPPRHSLPLQDRMRTMGFDCVDGFNCNTGSPVRERVTTVSEEGVNTQYGQDGQTGAPTEAHHLAEVTPVQKYVIGGQTQAPTEESKQDVATSGQEGHTQYSVIGGQTGLFKMDEVTAGRDYVIGEQTGAPTEGSKLEEVTRGQDSSTQGTESQTGALKMATPEHRGSTQSQKSDDSTQSQAEEVSQFLDAVSQPAESVTVAY